jgi:hypothetical protein
MERCVARHTELARAQGEGCVVLGARCRAHAYAEWCKRSCVRVGTRMPVVACLGGVGRVQSGAVAWPMGALGGNGRLGELGGG